VERAARRDKPSAAALAALGRVQLRGGEATAAEESLRAALAGAATDLTGAARVDAMAALADALSRRGDDRAAHEQLLQALAVTPARADLHARLGDVHRSIRNWDAALDSYDRAIALGGPAALLDRALDVATAGGRLDRAADYASRLLAAHPDHPRALIARDVAAATGRLATAVAPGAPDAGAAVDDALSAARRALASWPADAQARQLLVSAGRALLAADTPVEDLYTLARRVHSLVADATDLAADAARTIDSYDRPLLVTVMGEFSSGKSTFVNAFLGAEVAPVGITPTTATINVLKYGRERAGRIVYRDDRVHELPWEDVPRVLRAVDADEAQRIRFVEVLYPNDTLGRVNIF
jgi:tetratricopeptide (TPR) repeat protein